MWSLERQNDNQGGHSRTTANSVLIQQDTDGTHDFG
jgi:hypothetical protein